MPADRAAGGRMSSMMNRAPKLSRLMSRVVEEAANRVLALDPDTADRFASLEGRLVAVHLDGPDVSLYFRPEGNRLRVYDEPDGDAETTIRATPGALFAGAVSEQGRNTAGKVHIEGDAHLGQEFERLLGRVNPDWEEPLARAFGDIAGPKIAQALRGGAAWGREAGWSLAEQFAEYLRNEKRHLVSRAEMNEFVEEVDRLRETVDRLEARVKRLSRKH